jgi:hypothetical protein
MAFATDEAFEWFGARHIVANFAMFVDYCDFVNERQMRTSKETLTPVNFLQKQVVGHLSSGAILPGVTNKSGLETWHEILYAASFL